MMDPENLFRPFQACCLELISKPNMEALLKLERLIDSAVEAGTSVASIKDHLMFPLWVYLKEPNLNENYTIAVLNLMAKFHSVVVPRGPQSPVDMRNLLLNLLTLSSKIVPGGQKSSAAAEDLKTAICRCFSSLLRSCDRNLKVDLIYHQDFKLPLSHLVFQSLDWAGNEDQHVEVVDASLDVLESLLPREQGGEEDSAAASQFRQMLPGITSKLVQSLVPSSPSSTDKRPVISAKVIAKKVSLWTRYVCLVMADSRVFQGGKLAEGGEPVVVDDFDKVWLGKAQDHLLTHLQVISASGLATYPDPQVRQAILALAGDVSRLCSISLESSLVPIMEMLSCLSVDLQPASNTSTAAVGHLRDLLERRANLKKVAVEMAQSGVFETCDDLIVASGLNPGQDWLDRDQERLHVKLAKLHGFLVLLKLVQDSSLFFYSETYLSKLTEALLTAARLDSNPLVNSHFSSHDLSSNSTMEFLFKPEGLHLKLGHPEKSPYVILKSEDSVKRLEAMAKLLLECADLNCLLDFLINRQILTPPHHHGDLEEPPPTSMSSKVDAVNLLNLVILGIGDSEEINRPDCHHQVLDRALRVYLKLLNTDASGSMSRNCDTALVRQIGAHPPDALQSQSKTRSPTRNQALDSVIIKGCGLIAISFAKLGMSRVFLDENLVDVVVAILLRTDVKDSNAAQVLWNAMQALSEGCGFDGIRPMLRFCLEPMCSELTVVLRQHLLPRSIALGSMPSKRPVGLSTLLMTILALRENADTELDELPELQDTLVTLMHQLDLSWLGPDPSITTDILQIVKALVRSLSKTSSDATAPQDQPENLLEEPSISTLVKDLLLSDEMEAKLRLDASDEEFLGKCPSGGFHKGAPTSPVQDADHNIDDAASDEGAAAPAKPSVMRTVVEHTRHFISMVSRPQWQILAMEIVADALTDMKTDRDELLPLVHQVWQPLKVLFDSDDLFVLEKAFHLLRTFALHARDFVHRRTVDYAFPAIAKTLKKLQAVITDRVWKKTLAARQSRRLLVRMVFGIWEFLHLLDLTEMESDPVIDMVLNFVDQLPDNSDLRLLWDESKTCSSRSGTGEDYIFYFKPLRTVDDDILWLKLHGRAPNTATQQ